MMSVFTKHAGKHREAHEIKSPEMFYAEVRYLSDVTTAERFLRLVIADGVDGWLCAVDYLDTTESITLAQYPDIESAKAHAEGWVRIVHNVKDVIEWVPGKPSNSEAEAKSGRQKLEAHS